MKYAIVYLSIPLDESGEPTEADAQAIGEIVQRACDSTFPLSLLEGVEVMGTRLTRNNLVAPALSRLA